MNPQTNEIEFNHSSAFSKNVVEFVTIAHEYCKLAEDCSKQSCKEFCNNALKILSLLYLKALLLPLVEAQNDNYIEKFVSEGDWQFVHDKVIETLGDKEQYFDLREPQATEGEDLINVSLAECFADIYQATKDFTTLYQLSSEDAIEEALIEFKENFEQYWGVRLLAALNILHGIVFGQDDTVE